MSATKLRDDKISEYISRTEGVGAKPPAAVYAAMTGRPEWAPAFWRIPDRMHAGLIRWVLFGSIPGDFLQAILSYNLMDAAGRADDQNQRLLFEYAFVLTNAMPAGSHGPNALATWKGIWPAEPKEGA